MNDWETEAREALQLAGKLSLAAGRLLDYPPSGHLIIELTRAKSDYDSYIHNWRVIKTKEKIK